MMLAILIILAIIGLLALITLAVVALSDPPAVPPEPDLAAIYREGLHASVRLQRTAQDLERHIWTEAAQARIDAEGSAFEDQAEAG
jgi:hypothetical protein